MNGSGGVFMIGFKEDIRFLLRIILIFSDIGLNMAVSYRRHPKEYLNFKGSYHDFHGEMWCDREKIGLRNFRFLVTFFC